jgi:F-type H+-transporting ATPase subunit delta
MNRGLISERYAKALLGFAENKNIEVEIYEQAKFLQDVFVDISTLHTALHNPMISKAMKRKIILTACGDDVADAFKTFIDLLLANDREDCLQYIMLQYQELYRKSKNILHGKLITAVEIDDATKSNLIKSIELKVKGKLEVEKIVDPAILGGFILELDFVRWNASLSRQLNDIKKQYIERNRRII